MLYSPHMMTARRAEGYFFGGLLGLFFLYMGFLVVKNLIQLAHGTPPGQQQADVFDASVEKAFRAATSTHVDMKELMSGSHPSLGKKTAPIQIVEFVDFHCPYCKRIAPILRKSVLTRSSLIPLANEILPSSSSR